MRRLTFWALCVSCLIALPAAAEVTIDRVTVGNSGNACDTQTQGCFGTVAYTYIISKYEVTNAQYTEFLNAVAATDTYGLYDASMGSGFGGITRSGSSGSYTYSAIAGREDMPVNRVSFWDAARFANWLHNGQPAGAQDSTTTEDGAYTLNGYMGPDGSSISRNAGATIFLPSEDEWYKAAYFNGTSYYDYPAGSDTQTTCTAPGATANTANCNRVVDDLTAVGGYTASASPYGTFDQGGNVWEWNETVIGSGRGTRGGGYYYGSDNFAASDRSTYNPTINGDNFGFRVATTAVILGPDDFETGFGNYSNAPGDDIDWTRNTGGTPSTGTGPSVDHTLGTAAGYYMYTEASLPNNPYMTALLESPCITDFTGYSDAEINFYYHMLGTQMGTLYVDVTTNCTTPSWTNEFSVSGDQGDVWNPGSVDLTSYIGGELKLRFRSVTGSGWSSDIAIDDVVVLTEGAVCGDSTVGPGEDCDDGNTDPGDCCSPTCQYESAATECRADAGMCDVAEFCTGSSADCPADGFEPSTTECRVAAGVCDVEDYCDGAGACTPDAKLTVLCRATAGVCDIDESCDGVSDYCPADAFEPTSTMCRAAAGVCDITDYCDGVSAACADAFAPSTTECRADAGECDIEETCDGAGSCPADAFEPNGSPCEDGDVCTVADECFNGTCSPGSPAPDSDEDGFCDDADNCPITSNPLQENSDGLSAGDACQCGDLDDDGIVEADDVLLARQHLMGKTVTADLTRCNVTGPSDGGISDCDVADIYVLQRVVAGKSATVENTCQAYTGP